jgi:S-ribosylhomocysteine lyase LuxS involved in autoinducer biosynthesis
LKTVTGVSDISSETDLKLKCYNTSASNLRVEFLIPNNSTIEVRIIDILGRSENTVVKESKSAGSYSIDYNTSALKKGFYLVTLTNGSKSITQKIIL